MGLTGDTRAEGSEEGRVLQTRTEGDVIYCGASGKTVEKTVLPPSAGEELELRWEERDRTFQNDVVCGSPRKAGPGMSA